MVSRVDILHNPVRRNLLNCNNIEKNACVEIIFHHLCSEVLSDTIAWLIAVRNLALFYTTIAVSDNNCFFVFQQRISDFLLQRLKKAPKSLHMYFCI